MRYVDLPCTVQLLMLPPDVLLVDFCAFLAAAPLWPVDRVCSRLGSLFSWLAMFSRLLPGCLTPTCRQRRHNYICQATCPGCPLFPGWRAAECSLFSQLLPSRLFTRHYPLGRGRLCIAGIQVLFGGGESKRGADPKVFEFEIPPPEIP